MKVLNAFKKKTDVWHSFLGFVAAIIQRFQIFGFPLAVISLIIALIFIVYEALDIEKEKDSYFDLVEFLVGYCLGTCFSLCF